MIATGQQVTPAGVQSVFTGRVTGVRFGRTAGEIWVVAPGGAYRLSWKENRVVASARFDGAPGVHGIAVDPASQRVLVTTVGRRPEDIANVLPGSRPIRAPAVSQAFMYDGAAPTPRTTGADSAINRKSTRLNSSH